MKSGIATRSLLTVDGRAVAELIVANSYLLRLRGMLARRVSEQAIWLTPCNSVHGACMTVPLDVAQVDADGLVLRTAVLRPFGLVRPHAGTRVVVEARRGMFIRWGVIRGVRLGRDGPVPQPVALSPGLDPPAADSSR